MDHGLGIISPILEILEIEVFNILYKPRDIGNLSFSTSSYPGNIGNLIFPFFTYYPGNIGNMMFLDFLDFSKKDARRNFTQNGPVLAARSLI